MNDTSLEIDALMQKLFMQKTGIERMKIGCDMFDTAKRIVISSIRAKYPNLSSRELRQKVFLRFYGDEFSEEERECILESIK